jgi:hypothetical protein
MVTAQLRDRLLLPITPLLGTKIGTSNVSAADQLASPSVEPASSAGPNSRYPPNTRALRRLRRRGGPTGATSRYSAPGARRGAPAPYQLHPRR